MAYFSSRKRLFLQVSSSATRGAVNLGFPDSHSRTTRPAFYRYGHSSNKNNTRLQHFADGLQNLTHIKKGKPEGLPS